MSEQFIKYAEYSGKRVIAYHKKKVPDVPPCGPNHCSRIFVCGERDEWSDKLCCCPCLICREWIAWRTKYIQQIIVIESIDVELDRVRKDREFLSSLLVRPA